MKNKKPHFAFFKFSSVPSVTPILTHMDISSSKFSQHLLTLGYEILCTSSGRHLCVNENEDANPYFAFFFSNFQFFLLSLLNNTYGHFSVPYLCILFTFH